MSNPLQHTDAGLTYVERPGSGPTIVFLHGIGSEGATALPTFDHLPSDARLLAWNAPGYGGSAPLSQHWPTAADYAAVLRTLLDNCGVTRCTLIGHSLGTLIAAEFARANPQRVDTLILASCAAGYGVAVGGQMPASVQSRIADLNVLGPAEFARARAPRLVHDPELNPDTVARVEAAMSRIDPSGYAQAVRMLASGDLNAALRHVTVPCGFLVGTEDRVTPERQTLGAARAWGDAQGRTPAVERISQAGHAVYVQRPDAFAAAVMRLIRQTAPTAPFAMIGEIDD